MTRIQNRHFHFPMNRHSSTFRKALSVFAGPLFILHTATAATVPAPVSGDLYLAFRAAGGDGGSESYIVKLGQDTPFRNAAAGSTFAVSGLGNIAADLTAVYGADWSTRADLFWGVFGVRPSASSIIYGSKERNPVTSVSVSWPLLDTTSRNTTASQITSVLESIGGYKGREATENSTVATFQPNSADASSYHKQVATPGTNDFGSLSEWTTIEGDFGSGVSGTALDLYRIAGSGVTRVGSFTISGAGVVQFTAPSATPPVDVDSDGDGYFDSQETLAGTNPNNSSDFFRVQSITRPLGETGVAFNTIPARTYRIFYSESLAAGSWELIETIAGGASPALHQYTDNDPVRSSRAKGFYKVSVSQ
jgi:Bacterial TSP3 repeat